MLYLLCIIALKVNGKMIILFKSVKVILSLHIRS